MANSDYYQALGVTKTASADEIKRAYRKQALQYHPDRNKSKEADAKFKEVTKAYEVLSDPQKKQTYDQFGAAAFDPSAGSGPFGQGGMGGQGGPFSGASGQQAGRYGPFTYSYTTNGGGGSDFDFGGFSDPFDIFEQFFGGGGSPFGRTQRRQVYSLTISFMEAMQGAEKKVTINSKSQTIKIPKGVDTGSRIRFGDYDIVISVTPNKRFQREGADIITNEEISFVTATLGDQIDVETIDGSVKLRIPQGTQPDTVIRLSGKGAPSVRGTGRGNHYVRLKVVIPKSVTSQQKELLEQFGDLKAKKSWF